MSAMKIGIDLGGTKTEGVLINAAGEEVTRYRVPTPQHDYEGTLDGIRDVVLHLEELAGESGIKIGVGIPGSVSPVTNLVRNANSTWLNGNPLKIDLEAKLGRPIKVTNDANCLALSEALDGAAAGEPLVFAVILGTGTGGGLVVNGALIDGANGIAGECGHIPIAHESEYVPDCYCGRKGCAETYVSGPSVVRDYLAHGGEGVTTLQEVSERAEAGEELARETLETHLGRVGQMLGTIVNTIDPDVFVIGGGVSNLPRFVESLPEAISKHVFAAKGDGVVADVRAAKWGDSSGVRGAARLWDSA